MFVSLTIAFALVFVAIEVYRLVVDAGETLQDAIVKVVEYAIYAVIIGLLLALLARQAFNADWEQTGIVFITSLVTINHVGIELYRVRQRFAGSNRHLKYPSLSIAWDVFLVTTWFGFAYLILGIDSGRLTLGFGDALYLSAITITTTGFGDVTPPLPARPLAMLEPFLGYALLGVWVATLLQAALSSEKRDG